MLFCLPIYIILECSCFIHSYGRAEITIQVLFSKVQHREQYIIALIDLHRKTTCISLNSISIIGNTAIATTIKTFVYR